MAEEWRDASLPLPSTSAEEEREYDEREAAEAREAEVEGAYDWRVVVELRRAATRPASSRAISRRKVNPQSVAGGT